MAKRENKAHAKNGGAYSCFEKKTALSRHCRVRFYTFVGQPLSKPLYMYFGEKTPRSYAQPFPSRIFVYVTFKERAGFS